MAFFPFLLQYLLSKPRHTYGIKLHTKPSAILGRSFVDGIYNKKTKAKKETDKSGIRTHALSDHGL